MDPDEIVPSRPLDAASLQFQKSRPSETKHTASRAIHVFCTLEPPMRPSLQIKHDEARDVTSVSIDYVSVLTPLHITHVGKSEGNPASITTLWRVRPKKF